MLPKEGEIWTDYFNCFWNIAGKTEKMRDDYYGRVRIIRATDEFIETSRLGDFVSRVWPLEKFLSKFEKMLA